LTARRCLIWPIRPGDRNERASAASPLIAIPAVHEARELFPTGEIIGADEAQAIGLVNRVADDGDLLATTMTLARRIASMPHVALGYTKRNLAAAETGDFAASLELEALHQARCSQTEDHCPQSRHGPGHLCGVVTDGEAGSIRAGGAFWPRMLTTS